MHSKICHADSKMLSQGPTKILKCYKLEINTGSADLTVHIFLVSLGGLGDLACSLARD